MSAATTPAVVWKGPESLRPFLVAIDDLEPFPGNPRKGNVEKLRESLRRFGQVLPALADPSLGEGGALRIVARHHIILAATEEEWTHVAVVANDFGSEDEARAYLLADNRLAELGGYDEELLAEQVQAIRENFTGTGYSKEDADALAERLAAIRASADGFRRMDGDDFNPADGEPPPRLDERQGSPGFFEVPLHLTREGRADFARKIAILKREWGVDDTTAAVVRAVDEAAERT